jgi:teichuronic acid biosynthesis glycosyltransferase TuaG
MKAAFPGTNWTMSSDKLVSVIMPAYNCAGVIRESIRSVISQSYESWELIIVNDSSNDDTARISRQFAETDPRIRVIDLERNGGPANARNTGMQYAVGAYLAFLDSDDLWLPCKLEKQLEFMSLYRAAVSFTAYRSFTSVDNPGPLISAPARLDYCDLLKGNAIGCLTVMIDRSMVGTFSMPNVGHEDFATWLQLLRRGHTARGLQEDLARYRVSSNSLSSKKRGTIAWTWNIYRELEGLSPVNTLWCFGHQVVKAAIKHLRRSLAQDVMSATSKPK